MSASRRLDWLLIVALSWLLSAIGMTALLGPSLGLRGWAWLGVHHALCLVGVAHELRRAWRRRQERLASRA